MALRRSRLLLSPRRRETWSCTQLSRCASLLRAVATRELMACAQHRGPSLMLEHAKAKKEAEQSGTKPLYEPWDRDRDLARRSIQPAQFSKVRCCVRLSAPPVAHTRWNRSDALGSRWLRVQVFTREAPL
jgi:hypothetical protein